MIGANFASAYQQPMEAVIAALDSDATQGLTTEEARRRLAQYGCRSDLRAVFAARLRYRSAVRERPADLCAGRQ